MAESSYESDIDEQINRAWAGTELDGDEPYHSGAAKVAAGPAWVPTSKTLVPQFPEGRFIPMETGNKAEMYVPPTSAPLSDDRVEKAQDKTKESAHSFNFIMFKLVGVMLVVGAMIGSAYGGHGKTTIKPPDPTACSCSFSPAINTWVCSYDQACGGNGKGRSKNKLKLPKFNFKRWA